jgi:hypothetical protein
MSQNVMSDSKCSKQVANATFALLIITRTITSCIIKYNPKFYGVWP